MTRLTDDQAVRSVQRWLRDQGYYNGPIDGDWGPLSELAFRSVPVVSSDVPPPRPAAPKARADGGLVRIIMHWTGGTYTVGSAVEDYHFIIDGDGGIALGNLKPEDNISTTDGRYTPHALNANTGAIGVAIAAMHDAKEAPFRWGKYPMKSGQVEVMVNLVGKLAKQYGIKVDRRTILTHAEVQPTLGIRQNGKWDISVLPGDEAPRSAIVIGDILRNRIAASPHFT